MLKIERDVALARHTSLHVGGPARFFVRVTTDEELQEALALAQQKNLKFFILGKGSNTLFSDAGFPGLVIQMADRRISINEHQLTAASGVFMRPLVMKALAHKLRGLEELAGIPGTVGGAVRGNAGTWGTEMKDVLASIEVLQPSGRSWRQQTLRVVDCQFGYRDSIFKRQPNWVIVRAVFALKVGDVPEGQQLVAKDLRERHVRQPYDAPSAGSIFKNPDKAHGVFSGALIEQLGLKGCRVGGAEISTKHANFILNRGGASSDDVQALIRKSQEAVQQKFNIKLEPEIVIVPPT